MSTNVNKLKLVLLGVLLMIFVRVDAQSVQLYTTYPKITVSPGEVVEYNIELINNSNAIQTSEIAVGSLPKDWHYELKSGNYTVDEVSVLPKDRKTLNLRVFMPGKQTKGSYTFYILAKGQYRLPLTVNITKDGISVGELSSNQTNMEGAANSTFTYNATLFNRSSESQVYALSANAAEGWGIVFKSGGKQVSSVNVDPNQRQDILVEINAPEGTKKGSYKIPVRATSGTGQSEIAFDVVVTGSYSLELTTPSGRLNFDANAGSVHKQQLVVKNTGSSDINQINFSSEAPSHWEVVFEPARINTIKAGETANINATVKPPKNAMAGDYMVTFTAKSSETSAKSQFRVTVETSLLSGWIGLLFIAIALGSVYLLIRKYGRR